MNNRSVIAKTKQVGSLTLISRLFGLARELLMARFLGAGLVSDAFVTAYKIPNSLRKIFAEGALSAAFIPTLVKVVKKEGPHKVGPLMSLAFLVFEGVLFALCALIFWKAGLVIKLIAPGWFITPGAIAVEQTPSLLGGLLHFIAPAWYVMGAQEMQGALAITYLRILIAFILFLSSSALLTGALHSVNHFYVPAVSPVLLNIVFIAGILVCMAFGLPVEVLCYFILFGGLLQFLLHIGVYFKLRFGFARITHDTWHHFYDIFKKFIPCLFSGSIMEINLFVSTSLASYLPKGSISLIYYANRFMGIPLGVFAVSLSTILLPFFSHIGTYAPKRLSYYLYETIKLIFWVTVPMSLVMGALSEKIFLTLFLSNKFSYAHVHEAGIILIAFLLGLFFFSLQKILLNLFYSMHDAITPTYIALFVTLCNYIFCKTFAPLFGAFGLALAFTCSSVVNTAVSLFFLRKKFNFNYYFNHLFAFARNCLMQFAAILLPAMIVYVIILHTLPALLPEMASNFLVNKIGFWFWVSPLVVLVFLALQHTRKWFNIRLAFLD